MSPHMWLGPSHTVWQVIPSDQKSGPFKSPFLSCGHVCVSICVHAWAFVCARVCACVHVCMHGWVCVRACVQVSLDVSSPSWFMCYKALPTLFSSNQGVRTFWKSSTYIFLMCMCVYVCTQVFFGTRYRVYNFSRKSPNFQVPISHFTFTWSFTGHCCAPDSHCHRTGLIFTVLECVNFLQ